MATTDVLRRRSRAARRAVLATLLLLLPLEVQTAAQGESLFLSPAQTGDARAVQNPPDRLVLRRRLVMIDRGQLTALPLAPSPAPRTLTLNLFHDAVFTGIVEHTEPTFSGGVALSGRLLGVEAGTFTLVANDALVAGTVRAPGSTYRVQPARGGWHNVAQLDLARLPPPGEPVQLAPDRPEYERPLPQDVLREESAR